MAAKWMVFFTFFTNNKISGLLILFYLIRDFRIKFLTLTSFVGRMSKLSSVSLPYTEVDIAHGQMKLVAKDPA